MNEGAIATYTVVLTSSPASGVTVTATVAVPDTHSPWVTVDTDAMTDGDQNTLEFTQSDYSTPQTVTVKTLYDTDSVDRSVTLSHSYAGSSVWAGLPNDDLTLTVDDQRGMTVTSMLQCPDYFGCYEDSGNNARFFEHNLAIYRLYVQWDTPSSEGWTNSTTFKLQFELSGTATRHTTTVAGDYDICTAVRGDTAVYCGGNLVDDDLRTVSLTRGSGNPGTGDNPGAASVTGSHIFFRARTDSMEHTDADDETIVASVTKIIAFESGQAKEFVLATPITASTIINRNLPGSLAVASRVTEGTALDAKVELAGTVVNPGPALNIRLRLSNTPADDDADATIGGSAADVTCPGGCTVVLGVGSGESTSQSIPAAADLVADSRETFVVSVGAPNNPSVNIPGALTSVMSIDPASVTVTIYEPGVTLSALAPSPVPEGDTATYTVVLDTQPASNVVIGVSSNNADVTVDTDGGTDGNQNTLTFTNANWSTAQTVTVSAAQDADGVDDTATLTHAITDDQSSDEYDAVANVTLAVTVDDDETAGVTLSALSPSPVPEGRTATYTFVLDTQPASNVVIGVRSDNADVTVDTDSVMTGDQSTLTFTNANWNTAQTVTVSAGQDDDAVDDTATLTHAVVDDDSSDEYDGVADTTLTVTVDDDDTAGVTLSALTPSPVPEGDTATYTVVLDTQPASGDVVIGVRSDNADVTVDTDGGTDGNQNTLTFTSANWNTAQTVTVSAGQDDDGASDTATLTHAVADGRSSDEYDGVADVTLAVTVSDDERGEAGVTLSALRPSRVREGGTATYTVVLDRQPVSDVVITVRSNNGDVAANRARLTFTAGNWDTPQTVRVRARHDDDAVDDTATLTHAVDDAASSDEYDGVADVRLRVTVDDDDTAGVTLSALSPSPVPEGGTATYTGSASVYFHIA